MNITVRHVVGNYKSVEIEVESTRIDLLLDEDEVKELIETFRSAIHYLE